MEDISVESRATCKLEGVQKGMGPEDSFWYGKWD
jgi:hypothetical protein